jgi:hypothetical protein
MHDALVVGFQRFRTMWVRLVLLLAFLPLHGCEGVATALVASMMAGFLLGCLLLLLVLFVIAVLPFARKPTQEGEPDLHAPSAPSGLGVGSLVLSGMVAWVIFVPLGYSNTRVLLGTVALMMVLCGVVLHIFTLVFALFTHTQQPLDEEDVQATQRTRRWRIVTAAVYSVVMLGLGLWPWLVPL